MFKGDTIMACAPQVYLSASVSIAKKLREGTLKDDEALAEKVKNAYGEYIYERIISAAKKLLKYPDITRAAYDPDYKKAMDEKLS